MIKDIEGLLAKVYKEISDRASVAVVGLSGGADSTLVAILCSQALGADNVYGLHMPYSNTDKETFNKRSQLLADRLRINQMTIDISSAVDRLSERFERYNNFNKLSVLNQGNMRSRMRMVSLYTACCMVAENTGKRVRVIGTGNKSEDYIFYDTKYGDSACDLFPIGQLFKSEVYQLLEHFVKIGVIKEENIDRTPSAGLWEGQTDQGELGYSYDEMEPAILRCETGKMDLNNPIDKFVWERHINGKHKHDVVPVIDLGEFKSQ